MEHETKNIKQSVRITVFLFVACCMLLVASYTLAQGNVWGQTLEILRGSKGVVPCGTSYASRACTVCDVFVLIQNIINLLIFAAMSLGTLAALVIGIRFLIFSSSPKLIEETKRQFGWLVWGIVIVLGSWMFINTAINFVGRGSFQFWNTVSCQVSGIGVSRSVTESESSGSLPVSSSWGVLDSPGYADGIGTNTEGYTNYINEPPEGNGLETAEPGSKIYNSKINNYVQGANLNGVEVNRVKAIIQAESSGNSNAVHGDLDGQSSYGLMQVRSDTARLYDPSVKNLSDAEIGQKLMNDSNYSIDIGTRYYRDLYQKYGDNDLAAAAYNGGPVANKPSINCPGSYRWQCQYDNSEHTLANERAGHPGYGPTRRYVGNINGVYSQLSK